MNVCKECRAIGGTHKRWCSALSVRSTVPGLEQETYTEVTGNIVVHHPVKTKPERAVMSPEHPRIGDGYPHKRDKSGFCGSCGARKGEYHYKLVSRA